MFRAARFFPTFRDIMNMSGNVIALVIGPLTLVFFAVHLYCYVGMLLWGGSIKVGTIENISRNYDYLNFNTYIGGLLTMFQVCVFQSLFFLFVSMYSYISMPFIYMKNINSFRFLL